MQLAGELTKISLPSLIQLLRNGELTGKICLTQGTHTAFMYVDRGRVIHAESEIAEGLDALLELFVWLNGSFSFIEAPVDSIPQTIPLEEAPEKIIKEGLAYCEQRKLLEQLKISPRTIMKPASDTVRSHNDMFSLLNGKRTLSEIAEELQLNRREFTEHVHDLISTKVAVVADKSSGEAQEIKLPTWVISRLQQDNPDISQAIVDMVIWVDRVKCWMYQADADMDRIIQQLAPAESEDGAEAAVPENGDVSLPKSSSPSGSRQPSVEF